MKEMAFGGKLNRDYAVFRCLLLLLALQPTVGFSLLSDSLPFCSFFTLLSPPSYSHYLHIFFDQYVIKCGKFSSYLTI